jgi:hypothetical protein
LRGRLRERESVPGGVFDEDRDEIAHWPIQLGVSETDRGRDDIRV